MAAAGEDACVQEKAKAVSVLNPPISGTYFTRAGSSGLNEM